MKKLSKEDLETYQRDTRQLPIMTTSDDWGDVPYRPDDNCPICKGAGFLYPRVDNKVRYDKVIPCQCLLDSITRKQDFQTFENFELVKGTEKAFKYAQELAYGTASFVWLLIYGGTGCGKTHLCNAIVKEVRKRNLEAKMILAADLFAMLREAIENHKADTLLRTFKDIFFLAIDDYGVEYGSEWEQAKFDELMTSRYATAKPTVLITNKDLNDLPARVKSRFMDKVVSRVAHNSAPDYRTRRTK